VANQQSPSRTFSFWLIPNLPLAVTLAAALYLMRVYFAPAQFFSDADIGWHIRAGEWILDNHRLPSHDPFSFLELGRIWHTWEWISEVFMALVYRAGGLPAIVFVFALLLLFILWLWFGVSRWMGGSFLFAALFAPMLISATQLHWLARPHIISFLFLLTSLLYIDRMPKWSLRQGLLCFAVGCLWANSHPSFFMPILMLGAYLLKLDGRWRERIYVGAAFSAGTLVNPFFIDLHFHLYEFLTVHEYRDGIQEWMPFAFDKRHPLLIVPSLAVLAMGAALAAYMRRFHHAALLVFFLALALKSGRGIPLAALLALPVANVAFTEAFAALRTRWAQSTMKLSRDLDDLDREFGGYALLPLACFLMWSFVNRPDVVALTGFTANRYPEKAVDAMRHLPPESRILADVVEGGYLIWRFKGNPRVFIDGRGDYLGAGPYQDAQILFGLRPGWRQLMERYRFTHVLLPNGAAMLGELRKENWRTLFDDQKYVVLARPLTATSGVTVN
jgi:hypothetical protein